MEKEMQGILEFTACFWPLDKVKTVFTHDRRAATILNH